MVDTSNVDPKLLNIPVSTPAPTKETDPTLGIATHIGAVVTGVLVGWASTKLNLTIDATTQAGIALGVTSVVTTLVHFLQAKYMQVTAS